MKPGTYTVTLFQGELEAGTGSVSAEVISGAFRFQTKPQVSVSAGRTSSVTLTSSVSRPSTIWSIGKRVSAFNPFHRLSELVAGTVDGTPAGFKNADKIEHMHP